MQTTAQFPFRHVIPLALGLTALVLATFAGCETARPSPPPTSDLIAANDEVEDAADQPAEVDETVPDVRLPDSRALSARDAAMAVAVLPAVTDRKTAREISLYAALYKAAYTTNIGGFTRHYLLDPPDDPPSAWFPQGVRMSQREFELRVLAAMAAMEVPMRWTPRHAPTTLTEPVWFPGTRELATRIGIRIVDRDEATATVRARLTDATAHVGGSRQYVTATWDGEEWQISRDRTFIVW